MRRSVKLLVVSQNVGTAGKGDRGTCPAGGLEFQQMQWCLASVTSTASYSCPPQIMGSDNTWRNVVLLQHSDFGAVHQAIPRLHET